MADFLPPEEQRLYDSTLHNLRSRGMPRIDAEDIALDLVERLRAKRMKKDEE